MLLKSKEKSVEFGAERLCHVIVHQCDSESGFVLKFSTITIKDVTEEHSFVWNHTDV